jgi:hypothetical protein
MTVRPRQKISIISIRFQTNFVGSIDVGAQTAYSYTAAHPNNVTKLVIMDFPFPGFLPPEFGENGHWWFVFNRHLTYLNL